MKFVTRAHAKVDRIACPWLIRRFVDTEAEFLFVDSSEVLAVARTQDAIPYDVPDVELGHHGDRCSFDAVMLKYGLRDRALDMLAAIVRGADTGRPNLTDESAGLLAIATGFHALSPSQFSDDHALLEAQAPMYDALYAYCKKKVFG